MDFNTALARLLVDGKLRDAFAADPAGVLANMPFAEGGRKALATLQFADLEVQADILLRKRFDLVKRWMPRTCDEAGWSAFRTSVRNHLPSDELLDSCRFCEFLALSPRLDARERNRVRFVAGTACFSLHWVRRSAVSPAGLQVFFRWRGRWREVIFAFRL